MGVNEAIVNKRTIVFLKPDDVLNSLEKHQSEQQGLLNEERIKSNGCHIEEEEPPTVGIKSNGVEIEMQETDKKNGYHKEENEKEDGTPSSTTKTEPKGHGSLTIRRKH